MSLGDDKNLSAHELEDGESSPDLGLGDLLSAIKSDFDAPAKVEPPPENNSQSESDALTRANRNSEISAPADFSQREGEYLRLASAGSWGKLTEACEKEISVSGDKDPLAKLWWIKSELARGAVPAIVLAGPLEALGQMLEADAALEPGILQSMRSQSASLMLELGERLRETDLQSSLGFFERALKLSPESEARAMKALNSERDRIKKIPAYDRDKRAERALERLNEICRDLPKEMGVQPEPQPHPGPSRQQKRRGGSGPFMRATLVGGMAAGLAALFVYFLNSGRTDPELAELSMAAARLGAAAELPSLEPARGLGQLDALLYDMNKDQGGRPPADGKPDAGQPDVSAAAAADPAPIKMEQVVVDKKPKQPAPRKKERINTAGPVETREMRAALSDEPRRVERDEPKVQLFPEPNNYPGRSRGARDMERYIVLKGTDVLARPSLGSRIVDYLPDGSEIYVESELGAWLLLRSKQGRAGYILSNDAQPISDSYRH